MSELRVTVQPPLPRWQRASILGMSSFMLWLLDSGVAQAPVPAALARLPVCEALAPADWTPFTDSTEQLLGQTKRQLETKLDVGLGQVVNGQAGAATCTNLPAQAESRRTELVVPIEGEGTRCIVWLGHTPGTDPATPVTGGLAFCAGGDTAA